MAPKLFRQTMSGDEIIQLAVRLGLLAFLLYWSFVLVRPFIPILAWSMVLTVALYPPTTGYRASRRSAEACGHDHHGHQSRDHHRTGDMAWLWPGRWPANFAGQLGAGTLGIPSPPEGVKDWPIVGTQIYGFWDQASTNLRAVLRARSRHI